MDIREINTENGDMTAFAALSADWERENITHGLCANSPDDFAGMRVFGAYEQDRLIGYISTTSSRTDRPYSMVPEAGTPCWEIEELYIVPEMRSRGIGRMLYRHAEAAAKAEGAEFIFLSTATKDYKRILHFYIEELGMEFWNARLFKKL